MSAIQGRKDLVVSSFQAIVLLLFNDAADSHLTYDQLQTGSGLCE